MFEQISKITTIPVLTLKKLFNNIECYICHRVLENFLDHEAESSIDIGFGKLYILIEDNNVFYKFIPSHKFEENLLHTITYKSSPLIEKADDLLVQKIKNTYKDLF